MTHIPSAAGAFAAALGTAEKIRSQLPTATANATANANAAGALTTLMADLTDPGQAYAALAGCDAVVHMGERTCTLLLCFCFAAPCSVL